MSAAEKMVRQLAYELWEQAGRPDGRSDEFWFAARYESERREEIGEAELGRPVRLPVRPKEPSRHESAGNRMSMAA